MSDEDGVSERDFPCIWCGTPLIDCGAPRCCDEDDHPYPTVHETLNALHADVEEAVRAERERLVAAVRAISDIKPASSDSDDLAYLTGYEDACARVLRAIRADLIEGSKP